MNITKLINDIRVGGGTTLTEAQSKAVLEQYGVPVVKEWVVTSAEEAVKKADQTGYPVVLKGLGAKLTHKTERGLVKLNLNTAESICRAAGEIADKAGNDLEGFLLQVQVEGRREFVAGLFRDEQFGPVVMFGLGGVFTEALDDVVFRLAPLEDATARHMVEELHAKKLLAAFRGEKPADMESLVRSLVGLSRLGCDHPEIKEIDINPLVVSPDGRITAVDALIVLEEKKPEPKPLIPPVSAADVIRSFHPRSVAFVGASDIMGKWGFRLLTNVIAGGYGGQIYFVNPKGGKIVGRDAYRSLADIPGTVDLAVVTVPAAGVIDLLPAMEAKGVKSMLLISSGFSETGPEGQRLEQELVAAARKSGVLIVGPNTMGSCNPHLNFYCTGIHARPKPGSMALIHQSGNMGAQFLAFAEQEGIGIRAFIGSGNEAMTTVEDYLEAFADDELTKAVVLYIESVKNGRRFFEAARRIGRHKPIILLKGGRTSEGNRAAASHTGALASNSRVFEAACRQAGGTMVKQSMDLLDISASFSSLPLPRGKRVGIMTLGGGWGVIATDLCVEYGLEVPNLPGEIISRINKILPPYWSQSNPVDLVGISDSAAHLKVMEELLRWDGCDAYIHLGAIGRRIDARKNLESIALSDPDRDRALLDAVNKSRRQEEADFMDNMVRLMDHYGKPIVGIYLASDADCRTIMGTFDGSPYQGVIFRETEQAAKALSQMYAYNQWLDREGVPMEERSSSARSIS
ncbi:MAG: acetate--CoA ligase family protein [Syntrophales bacterium]|nr:acetate--CoA ligase family protein [Syntrophales bacterium]